MDPKSWEAKVLESQLKRADELRDIEGDSIEFVLDVTTEIGPDTHPRLVINYGEIEVCREYAFYDGASRFPEIAKIFSEKYGTRMKDIVPTDGANSWLAGDVSDRPIRSARKRIRRKYFKAVERRKKQEQEAS